uniref:Uncharacterized protein n=1 Tax=Vespula pensylvanica TaxID=30213 RepID=A0A834N418_VESPE|nr:hypothetical protein H0235_016784 [Vespula pensylvanica]
MEIEREWFGYARKSLIEEENDVVKWNKDVNCELLLGGCKSSKEWKSREEVASLGAKDGSVDLAHASRATRILDAVAVP